MRKMKDKKNSISKQLVKSYLLLFPLFLLMIGVVAILGSFISHSLLAPALPSHEFNLEAFMQNDITEIDISRLVDSGGGGAIVFGDGSIEQLAGSNVFDKTSLSKKEWTDFLIGASDPSNKQIYSIAYNEEKDFWLVVSTPVSLRLYISFTGDPKSENFIGAFTFYTALISILLLLLLLGIFLYARKSSKTFIVPLRKLCKAVRNITNREYDMVVDKNFSGEFLLLSNDVYKLSAELKQEKLMREKLESEKKQMLLDISHDMRNPLATIMGYAEMLKSTNMIDSDTQSHYIEVINRNSIRANHLMDDLFMYTKLDAPTFQPSLDKYDICELMREQVSLFLPQFELKRMNTIFEIPDKEILIEMDKGLLSRAFSNLFSNCITYNTSPITFTLTVTEEKENIQIIIKDDGIGIDEKLKDSIFEPFMRSDESRNSKTGGSGLGLAIVRKIIVAHKGNIILDTARDKGCTFMIRLIK